MKLAVELYGVVIGHLDGADARTFDFVATGEAAAEFGVNSRVLSVLMPLAQVAPRQHAGRRRNWFAELLPEGDQLDYMLALSGIRRGDVPSFLARYGRDVAGAVQIWDVDDPTEPRTPDLLPVDATDVRELLQDPLGSPLANAPLNGKSSLGGVQPKVVLAWENDRWNQAVGGFPSTHILKPQLDTNPTVIYDEEYGGRLARGLGLAEFDTRVDVFDGLPALVVERFDRAEGARIHQEDFNQALGASGNQKYQEIGGVVSLRRVADSLYRFASSSDLARLAQITTLAVAVGNLDLHTKNLGLLHDSAGNVSLAPAYDMVPMAHHRDADGKLALAVNKKYRHSEITRRDLVAEMQTWGLRRPDQLVAATLERLNELIAHERPLEGAHPMLRKDVLRFTRNLVDGRAAGAE
ncbi:type II toxin-antitoxin system HipA family toxin [Microbacterium kribbense]|uniref:Type II toxin-antitoxin system HipA family toxin n=1 Tax=Microbacterium kribbense TaxID=433645 RepID=A0ABP7GX93_9MICO